MMSLEDKIYHRISKALDLEEDATEGQQFSIRPTENNEAYDLYLQGRAAFLAQRDITNLRAPSVFTLEH